MKQIETFCPGLATWQWIPVVQDVIYLTFCAVFMGRVKYVVLKEMKKNLTLISNERLRISRKIVYNHFTVMITF